MKILLSIIVFLSFAVFSLKQTFGGKVQTAVWAVVCGIATICFGNLAISLSKAEILALINNTSLMKDLAVIICLETALHIAFCIMAVRAEAEKGHGKNFKFVFTVLKWFPGVTIFPAAFFLLTALIFSIPGTDFDAIRYTVGGAIMLVLPAQSYSAAKILPEKDIRTELLFITSTLLAMASILLSMK